MHPNVTNAAFIHGDYLMEVELAEEEDEIRLRAILLQLLDERQLSLIAKS